MYPGSLFRTDIPVTAGSYYLGSGCTIRLQRTSERIVRPRHIGILFDPRSSSSIPVTLVIRAPLLPPLQRHPKMTTTSGIGPNATSEHRLTRILNLSKRRTGIQLPPGFVRIQRPLKLATRRSSPAKGATPLAKMLRGGQGGEVRLKLYLTITLLAADKPFDISRKIASRTWAEMLGLPDPEGHGARRVTDALTWLADNDFVKLERTGGTPPKITLCNALGNGLGYAKPTVPYVTLPIGFWQKQWLTAVSGTATALLLVLLELTNGKDRDPRQWVDSLRRAEYCLSEDSWTRATKELVDFGLIEVDRETSGRDLEFTRRRNVYQVFRARLDEPVPLDVLASKIEERAAASKRKPREDRSPRSPEDSAPRARLQGH